MSTSTGANRRLASLRFAALGLASLVAMAACRVRILDTRYLALVDLTTKEMSSVYLAGFGGELVQADDVVYVTVSSSSDSYIWAFALDGTPRARFEMPRGADVYSAKVFEGAFWTNNGRRGLVYRIPLSELAVD